jgi:hypothetical protein
MLGSALGLWSAVVRVPSTGLVMVLVYSLEPVWVLPWARIGDRLSVSLHVSHPQRRLQRGHTADQMCE